jgi:hypothetical protein
MSRFCATKYFTDDTSSGTEEIFESNNSLAVPPPRRIDLERIHSSSRLESGDNLDIPLLLHTPRIGDQDLCILLVYREVSSCLQRL